MKAMTPKKREVEVYDIQPVGTCCHSGRVKYGDIPVGYWCGTGLGANTLQEALIQADNMIDECGLSV